MKILAHRGAWNIPEEKNTINAISDAFRRGWGVETDIRDYRGRLVVAHDVADENAPFFEEILCNYRELSSSSFLAVNVKADGIQQLLLEQIVRYKIVNYAVFDMSVPEKVVYQSMNIPFLSRQSEIEPEPVLYGQALGIWMDQWREEWITDEIITDHIRNGKIVGIISPEIHGMNHLKLWDMIKAIDSDQILLCTDMPKEAEEYFYG